MHASRSRLAFGLVTLLVFALAVTASPAVAQTTENDLAYEVLSDLTNEPLVMDIAPDGRIIWGQRDGLIHVLTPAGAQILAGAVMPAGNLCATCEPEPDYLTRPPNRLGVGGLEEGGLHGLLLHRNFAQNNLLYVYRSIPGTRKQVGPNLYEGEFRVSTFRLDPLTNLIDRSSEKVILAVPAEWDHCCHYGGDMDYLPDGTIVLATGDDIDASASGGYGPRDHRNFWTNGELTAANPADRRGKILRFNEDGSVPDGSVQGVRANPFLGMEGFNPYIADTSGTPGDGWIAFDPYVYSLGWKQPWRQVVHPGTGHMYVSDVGPDATSNNPNRGPAGLEEINFIPFGGGTHAGWPRCAGPNIPYIDVNWETLATNGPLDCSDSAPIARPIGDTDPASIQRGMSGSVMHYPSGTSTQWPIVGSGGKTSEPVAFYPAETKGPLRLPARYDNRMLLLEWSRDFILSIGYDPKTAALNLDNGDMWRVTPPLYSINADADKPYGTVSAMQAKLMHPVDGKVGPDGAFYFLEYGAFFYAGANGRLARIKCAGCAPSDPSRNYGLPVDGGLPAATSTAGLGFDLRQALTLGLGLGLVVLARRRRRVLV